MNLKDNILKLNKKELKYIWSYTFDEGYNNELILDPGCIYLEISDKLLKLCDVEGEGKIEISLINGEDYISDMDITYKIDISNYIFDYPETNYYVEKIGVVDMVVKEDRNICLAVQIEVNTENYGKQTIFIHSGLFGLEFARTNKRKNWIQNYYIPLYGDNFEIKWIVK